MRITEPYTIFPRTLNSGKTVYYYQYRQQDGSRSTAKSTGQTTLAGAKRFCNKLYNSGEFEKTSSTRFSVYVADFFEKDKPFYQWKKVSKSNLTENTLDRYKQLLKYQLIPYFDNYQISNITRQTVKSWIVWASERWSDKTVNNAQTVLNHILNQAVEENIIKYNPANNLSFRETDKVERELLTFEEVYAIYHSDKWKDENRRLAFLLTVITGMRIGEVVCLRNEDIAENYINVRHNWVRKHGMSDCKTHLQRYVPKPTELILKSDNGDFLFPSSNGQPFNISRMRDNLFRICVSLGIDYNGRNLNTHTLRNYFITYLQRENVSESKIKAIVGHKDSTMTGLYTYWKPDMFPEVYEAQYKLYKGLVNER